MTLLDVGIVPRRRRTAPTPAATSKDRHESADAMGRGGSCGCAVPPVATAAAAAQPNSGQEGGERDGEGMFLAADQSPPPCAAAGGLRPIAAVRRRAQSSTKNKKRRRPVDDGVFWAGVGMEPSPASAANDPSFDGIGVVDGALRAVLSDLGASPPVRVYGKRLQKTDRMLHQNRLLMPWPRGEPFPLDEALTAEEKEKKPSLQVQAYDRRGRPYVLGCTKLDCNDSYRLIGRWGSFLTQNGLHAAVDARAEDLEPAMVELWAFRLPALAGQPLGPLGLVVMHYLQGDAPHADAAIEEILADAARKRAAMPPPLPIDSEPDEATLEAAQGLLMLRESPVDFSCREKNSRLSALLILTK